MALFAKFLIDKHVPVPHTKEKVFDSIQKIFSEPWQNSHHYCLNLEQPCTDMTAEYVEELRKELMYKMTRFDIRIRDLHILMNQDEKTKQWQLLFEYRLGQALQQFSVTLSSY